MKMKFLVLLCAVVGIPLGYGCPPAESVFPCSCLMNNIDMAEITCSGIENEIDLQNAMSPLIGKTYIYAVDIRDSVFNYLSQDIFKGLQFVELMIDSSSFMDLTDTDIAFEGLENHLELLYIRDCSFMNDWDWSKLRNQKVLRHIDIVGGDLESIGEDIAKLGHLNLTKVSFDRNDIAWVYEKAFSTFQDLELVTLTENKIETVARSMFPRPAEQLMSIELSFNKIQSLPEDLLTDMPSLIMFSLRGNRLLTLNEKTFIPVWEQLQEFDVRNNEIRCDCRLAWVLKLKFPDDTTIPCSEPPSLKHRELRTLTAKDLWC